MPIFLLLGYPGTIAGGAAKPLPTMPTGR